MVAEVVSRTALTACKGSGVCLSVDFLQLDTACENKGTCSKICQIIKVGQEQEESGKKRSSKNLFSAAF